MRCSFAALTLLSAVFLAGCGGGGGQPMPRGEEAWKGHGPLDILRRYAGADGRLTRQDLETGLRRDFDAADTNHDGVLEPDEARAVNKQRWAEDQSAISPLQDWNGDGVIDFNEFAATARALFHDLDRDGNGVLTADELRISPPPGTKPGDPAQNDDSNPDGQRGGRRGH